MIRKTSGSAAKALVFALLTLGVVAGASGDGGASGLRPAVPPGGAISITPSTNLVFNAPLNGPNPPPQILKVKNTGVAGINWTAVIAYVSPASPPVNWLTVSPPKGHRNPGQSKSDTVSVAMTTLAAGTYTATITYDFKGDAGGANAVVVNVTLHVLDKAFIDVQPSAGLIFNAPTGSGLQPTQDLTLSNLGGQVLNNWTATIAAPVPAWLKSVNPPSGATLASGGQIPLTVTVDATGLVQGTYLGEIDVTCANPAGTSNGAAGLPIKIPITLKVTDAPVLEIPTAEVDFNAPTGSPNPPAQSVTVRNAGGSTLNCTNISVQGSPAWLSVSPTVLSGIAPGVTEVPGFTLTVDTSTLGSTAQTLTATVLITTNAPTAVIGGVTITDPTQFTVLVVLSISDTPVIDAQPSTGLAFSGPEGGPDPTFQTITVSNLGGGTLSWQATILGGATWLSLSKMNDIVGPPTNGPGLTAGASEDVQVLVSVAGLAAGSYSDTISFDDTTGNTVTVFVQLDVIQGPSIHVSQTSLLFDVPTQGAPSSQTVTITNVGSGPVDLTWGSTSSQPSWLSATPSGSTLTAGSSIDVTITVDPSSFTVAGSLVAQMSITGNAPNSPQIISVTVNINSAAKIQLSPSTVSVDVGFQGAAVQQTVMLQNVGAADLVYTTSAVTADGGTWLGVSTGGTVVASQSTPITLTFTPGTNPIGVYTAVVTIASTAGGPASNTPQTVFCTMHVIDVPRIDLSPSSLVFNLSVGAAVANQQVTLKDIGGGAALSYQVQAPTPAWLSASPLVVGSVSTGSTTPITVSVDPNAGGPPLPAGTYTGTVRVDSTNAQNAPQFISVTMNLTDKPRIGLSPAPPLSFTTGVGVTPANQTVTVTNTGGGTGASGLIWTASASVNTPSGGTWLKLSPVAPGSSLDGGAQDTFDVAIDVTGLAAGSYSGTVTVAATGATNTPQSFGVTLTVLSGPAIGVSPGSLTFTTPVTVVPGTQTLTVTNTGGTALDWSTTAIVTTPVGGNWLKITGGSGTGLAAGTSSPPFNIDVDVSALVAGTYSATVRITGTGASNSPLDVLVTLHVLSDPQITVSPALVFTVIIGTGNPTPQTATVTNIGDQTLNWSAAASVTTPAAGTWLALNPVSPSGLLASGLPANFDVTVDVTGLGVGSYSGTVTVTGAAPAIGSPALIPVTLNINNATPKIPKAGYCGSVGFDVALPLILLWVFRKWRGARRAAAGVLSAFLVLVFSLTGVSSARADELSDLPRSLAQEEKAPERPTEMPKPAQEEKAGEQFFDFAAGALNLHIGVLDFSSDFHAKAEVCGGLGVRIPSPFLSTIFGPERDRIGFLLDVTGSGISRDITGIQDKSGTLIFVTAGVYGTFVRTESFEAQVEVGGQYGYFGGVTNLTNGFAAIAGLRGALELASGLWATLEPEIAFGTGGSRLYFVNVGVDIQF